MVDDISQQTVNFLKKPEYAVDTDACRHQNNKPLEEYLQQFSSTEPNKQPAA